MSIIKITKKIKIFRGEIMVHTSACPHCNSKHFIKYGKYRCVQRYQ
ncbi:transposase-like zinc-binding domain-containing protein, partial [Clostridium chrysemydis]